MDNEFLNRFNKKLEEGLQKVKSARMEDDRRQLMATIGQDLAKMMSPFLAEVARTAKTNKEDLREAMFEILGQVNSKELNIDTSPLVAAIENAMMGIKIPEPKVSVVVPPDSVKMPDINFPDEMNVRGFAELMGMFRDQNNPISVQLRDAKGNPVNMDSMTTILGGGSGGSRNNFFTIKGYSQSAFAEIMNPDGFVRVMQASGSSGLTDTELRAAHLDVQQLSGSIDSVYVTGIFGTTITGGIINGDDRIRVSVETGGSGLTDAELRAAHLDVLQVSGAIESMNVTQIGGNGVVVGTGYQDNALRVVLATDAVASVSAILVAGAASIGTLGANSGVDIGDVTINNAAGAAAVNIQDGGNAITVDGAVTVSGTLSSTVATGPTVADAADDGSAPIQIGGIARTANPGAVAANDVVKSTHDDLGRQVVRPVQVRDLILTAYATLTTGTETTLRAAVAGAYLDLIMVVGANNSDAAVSVDLRAVTAGNVVGTLQIPANGTAGFSLPIPYPAQETGNNWTADMGDITGTTVSLTALFSQEV